MMKSPSSSADSGGAGDAVKSEVNIDDVVIKEEPGSDPLESGSPVCGSGGEDLLKTDDVKVKEEPIDLDEPEFIPDGTIVKTEDVSLETPVTIKCDTQGLLKDETEENPFPPDFDPEDEEAYKDFLEDSGGPSDPGQISTGAGQFVCYYCGGTYHKKSLLGVHVKTHHLTRSGETGQFPLKTHLCPHCDYECFLSSELEQHMAIHQEPSLQYSSGRETLTKTLFECKQCPHKALSYSRLWVHVQGAHLKKLWQCKFCDFTTGNYSSIQPHEFRKHAGELYSCHKCSQKFLMRFQLRFHMSSKHGRVLGAGQFVCFYCGCTYHKKSLLAVHVKTHQLSGSSETAQFPLKTRLCPHCDYRCFMPCELAKHMVTHKEAPFRCASCPFVTRTKFRFRAHSMNHEGILHKCKQCTFKARSVDRLRHHKAVVHLKKWFRCFFCDFTTIQSYSLHSHESRKHAGELYSCRKCTWKSPKRSQLRTHVSSEHSNFYHCFHCGWKGTAKWYLRKHIWQFHPPTHNVPTALKVPLRRKGLPVLFSMDQL